MSLNPSRPVWVAAFVIFITLIAAADAHVAQASSSGVVISAVYGGGSATDKADWRYDYVELFNAGSAPVSLDGWSIQYAAATQTTWNNWTYLPDVRLLPGQYFLIQEAADSNYGSPLPDPDFINLSNPQNPHHIGSVSHKVALFRTTTRFSGGANPSGDPQLVDLVGYGDANAYEGSNPAPALNTEIQAVRKKSGCLDNDDNASDFKAVDQFTPRNTRTTLRPCGPAKQLLLNSDFNSDANSDHVPDTWLINQRTDDDTVCNSAGKRVSFAGDCAFQFQGGSDEHALLEQSVDLSGMVFNSGDRLILSTYMKAKDPAADMRFMIKVKYGDANTRSKVVRAVGTVGGYTLITVPELILRSGNVTEIVVRFKHKSLAGEVCVDGAMLMLYRTGSRGGDSAPLPVPSAFDRAAAER